MKIPYAFAEELYGPGAHSYICNLSEMFFFFVRVRKAKIPFLKKLVYSIGEAVCLTEHTYFCISMFPLVINPLQSFTIFPDLFFYTNTIVY